MISAEFITVRLAATLSLSGAAHVVVGGLSMSMEHHAEEQLTRIINLFGVTVK